MQNTNKKKAISIQNLTKSFGPKKVIDNLSFEVQAGEIFAFLGANGSGKTTTIRCLLNIYQPNKGTLRIQGQTYTPDMGGSVGYLPEERGLYSTSRVLETLIYFGKLKGMCQTEATTWSEEYLEKVELSHKANTDIKLLSSGQQQKIQLGISIINHPEILILDEPTKGLDPLNRELLMEYLLELNKLGSTIVFVTHQMEEVEKIADRLVMIKEGKRVLYGRVDEVKQQFGTNTIHLQFEGELPQNDDLYQAKVEHKTAELAPQESVTTDEILRYLLNESVKIRQFQVGAPSLQEIFVRISKGK